MSLSPRDIVDLEVQLYLDRDAEPSALAARDRSLRVEVTEDRAQTIADWMAALRETSPTTPGVAFVRATRWVRLAVIVFGTLLGGSVGTALLAYDGSEPVNVLNVLAVAALLQAVLAVVAALGLITWKAAPSVFAAIPFLDDFRTLTRAAQRWGMSRLRRHWDTERFDGATDVLNRMRTRRGLYSRLESWTAFGAMQTLALAFNVGLLASMFRLIALTDLTFGWGSTMSVGAEGIGAFTSVLSAPWAWAIPQATPTPELIEATNFARFGGTFSEEAGATLAGQWWPFVVTSTVVYGLLPRLGLSAVSWLGVRRTLDSLPLNTPDIDRALRRLSTPIVKADEPAESEAPGLPDVPELPSLADGAFESYAIRWGAIPSDDAVLAQALARELGASVDGFHHAGGKDYREDSANLERLGQAGSIERLIVIVEAFDEPDRALRRFLGDARTQIGKTTPLIVAVVEELTEESVVPPAPADVNRWRRMVGTLADPYLDVQPLGGSQ